eukprot:8109006-Pyramimonas_sp.AAC.1
MTAPGGGAPWMQRELATPAATSGTWAHATRHRHQWRRLTGTQKNKAGHPGGSGAGEDRNQNGTKTLNRARRM